MGYKYVTAEQVVDVHADLLIEFGGLGGGGHRGAAYEGVEAAVRAVENAYYDDPHDLAAAYAVYIVQGHVFLDGNKRAASYAMCEFLRGSGFHISPDPLHIVRLMVELQQRSEGGEGAGSLIRWLGGVLRGRRVHR